MTGVLITPSSEGAQVTEAGPLDTYKIQLASAPLTSVTVTIKTDRQTLIAKPNRSLHPYLNIMPIGDSITYGVIDSFSNTQSGGYRTYLWKRLKRDHYAVNFIGSQSDGPGSIDRDHEGYRGKTIDGIANSVVGKIAEKQPDIILLLAGTNDILKNRDLTQAPQRLGRLIDQSLKQSNAALLVGTLPPNTRSQGNLHRVQAFNKAIVRLIDRKKQQHQSVQFVDLYHSLSNQDLADRTHPTAKGYQKMADTWYDSLLGVLNSSANLSLANTQTFTFTPQNWQAAQTVTVVAKDDQRIEGIHKSLLFHQTHSADDRYRGLEATLPVTVVDDDPGIVLIPAEPKQSLQQGETASYQVKLSRKPTTKAIVHLSTDPQLRLSRSKLKFTPARWQRPQTVAIKAVEGAQLGDLYQGKIRYTIQSQDFHYQNLGRKQIVLTATDQDQSEQSTVELDSLLQPNKTLKRTSSLAISNKADDRFLDFGPSSKRMPLQNQTSMIDSTRLSTEGPAGLSDQMTVQNYRTFDHSTMGIIESGIELTSISINHYT